MRSPCMRTSASALDLSLSSVLAAPSGAPNPACHTAPATQPHGGELNQADLRRTRQEVGKRSEGLQPAEAAALCICPNCCIWEMRDMKGWFVVGAECCGAG